MKTDIQIKHDVLAELEWEPAVDAAPIGVEVREGVVTLAGQVDSYSAKQAAEKAAQRVGGVKALAVEMKVRISGYTARTDADIARSVEGVLQWTTYLGDCPIKVKVEAGWVTLTGTVEWDYQRTSAQSGISDLMGVTGVDNQLVISTKVTGPAVKAQIESALKRWATDDANKIAVEVKGSQVTLSGQVHSWSELDMARHSAWGTPGVTHVVDNMTITSS
ncbi:MAG: BON domain-containing protein [Ramlibacter sp.]